MTLDADAVAERRRLKRRVTFWRIVAVLAIVAIAAVFLARERGGPVGSAFGLGSHVARVTISGFITDSPAQQKLLREIAESSAAEAVIVRIDSPGGSTAGGEALYSGLRDLTKKKPVVVVFATTATSAAYMAAIAADHIVSRANSITGSVGVIVQWARVTELLESLGVEFQQLKSGELKAVPSPFEPTTERQREATRELLRNSFEWFVARVEERRDLSETALADIRTGRIYTGLQAKDLGLVDQIGGEPAARQWLEQQHGVSKTLNVMDWKPDTSDRFGWFQLGVAALASVFGADVAATLESAGRQSLDAIKLDGLVSVWQPEK